MIPSWMEDAKCAAETAAARKVSAEKAQRVADAWFPPEYPGGYSKDRRRELDLYAPGVCAGCPVIAECLRFAMSDLSLVGVWGGTHHVQRQERAQRRKAA